MIHIEGMGIVGSFVARFLHERGVEFTWDDIASGTAAWPASTGAIYPSGNQRDRVCYQAWAAMARTPVMRPFVETASYWYVTKNAPHGGSDQPAADFGHIRRHALPSYHLNAQEFVRQTRREFASREAERAPDARVIVAHGFNQRLTRYVWGWTALVRLNLHRNFRSDDGLRPCLYFRPNKFTLCYAYPVPGTEFWYAGSSLIVQKVARELNVPPKFERWTRELAHFSQGWATLNGTPFTTLTGWRPSLGTTEEEATEPLWRYVEGVGLVVMPMWHSGIRWIPAVLDELAGKLRATGVQV